MNDNPAGRWRAELQPPFADFMGMRVTHVSPERVTAEMTVTETLSNRNGVLHGGALMALADNLGGTAAVANLGHDELIAWARPVIRQLLVGDAPVGR